MKVWALDHNSILKDLDFDFVKEMRDADVVFLWNDVNPVERGIINLARSRGQGVYTFQHGRKGTSKYFAPFHEEIQADKLFVWGEFDKKRLIEAGRDPERIVVAGTTVFSRLKPKKSHDLNNIVFCPEHWDRPVDENMQVRDELRKLGMNITTKIIESHDEKTFDNPVSSNRDMDNHLDICADVLSTADVVVGVSESTFELLAQALDIPVVLMNDWEPKAFGGDMRYTNYERLVSDAVHQTSVADLNMTVKHALEHPTELRKQRMRVVRDEGGYGLNTSAIVECNIKT